MDEEDIKTGAWLGKRLAITYLVVVMLVIGSILLNLLLN